MELQLIQNKIYEIRGRRIMLDFDLAEMYGVETKSLNLSVKRNIKRFPSDFMFQLSVEEWDSLRLQIETSKRGEYANLKSQFVTSSWGGTRRLPYAFTQQGVAMLSGLLNSDIAISVNINIMRAFIAVRNYVLQQSETSREIEELWKAINDLSEDNQKEFDDIYLALSELAAKQKIVNKPRNPIGFKTSQYTQKIEN